jgi:hypothetical protein
MLQPINWNLITKAIKNHKCLLIIGHDAVLMPDRTTPIFQSILQEVKEDFPEEVFYQTGDEFMYTPPNIQDQVYEEIAGKFERQNLPFFYEQLAQIPFFMMLNVSPDLYLKNLFEEKKQAGFQFHFDYYQAQALPQEVPKTNGEAPLLYNLFGTTQTPNSMVFSYDKLFNYLDSLMNQKYKLHPSMTSQIRDAESIVFLGFKFNKLYLNLLLWLLGFHEIKRKKFASGRTYQDTLEFVKKQFAIDFVMTDIPSFVQELHQKCQEEKLLRSFHTPTQALVFSNSQTQDASKVKQELLDCIDEADFSGLFEKIDELVKSKAEMKDKLPRITDFRNEYIHGKADHTYSDRIKVFIQTFSV